MTTTTRSTNLSQGERELEAKRVHYERAKRISQEMDAVCQHLSVISEAEEGDRLDTEYWCLCKNTYWTSLWRRWAGQSRHTTIAGLSNLVDQLYNVVSELDAWSRRIVLRKVASSMRGLHHLCRTYQEDPDAYRRCLVCKLHFDLILRRHHKLTA